ncbi:MAG: outer membrane protein transport protein [Pirellulales bacterium]|nr:outer membrane protein transport protein [Pirellulales bacterium]
MSHFLRLWGGFFVWLASASIALADGVMLNSVSPRSLSRGGTNLAFADNGAILFDNPAGMTNIDGGQLCELGLILPITTFHYTDAQNNVWDTGATPLPQASYIRRSADGVWAFGIGFFVPAGFDESYTMQGPPQLPGSRRFESFGALAKILPGIACRVTDELSIGATLGVGYSYAKFEAPYILQGPTLPGLPVILNTHGAGASLLWSVGAQYRWSDATMLGAAYTSPAQFTLNGNTDLQVPGIGQSSYDSTIDMTWPQTVGIGLRHEFCPHRIGSVDVVWYDWASALDDFSVRIRDPSNPAFPPQVTENFPMGWHGSVAAKFGYEQMLPRGTMLRLGYIYNNNPLPVGTLTPLLQAFFQHAVSVGLGWQYCDWDIDLGYMHMFAPDQRVGTSDFVGGQFSNADHQAAVDAIFLGLIHHR